MKLKYLALISIFLLPVIVFAQIEINAGFVSGIWYSKEPFFAGEDIRIYGAIQNHSSFDIDGTLRFFDRGSVIGEKDFSAVDGGLIQEWIDWKVVEGTHEIKVEVVDAVKSSPGGEAEPVVLRPSSSAVSDIIVDSDTDGDGIGNNVDIDDDNDGLTDKEEEDLETDPLDSNDPGENRKEDSTSDDEAGAVGEVLDKAKDVSNSIQEKSEPILSVAQDFFKNQAEKIERKIEEEKQGSEESKQGTLKKFAEKLPPVLRIVYLWLLKVMIWIFSAWWKVLLLAIEIFILLRKAYRKFFG